MMMERRDEESSEERALGLWFETVAQVITGVLTRRAKRRDDDSKAGDGGIDEGRKLLEGEYRGAGRRS